MEELLVLALLLLEDMITPDAYEQRLDELFLNNSENEEINDFLLHLECETGIIPAIIYFRTHVYEIPFQEDQFGRLLMQKLQGYYQTYPDSIKSFGDKMYALWENLPEMIQDKEPFRILSYADDPLSWGDEELTRRIYEHMLHYYNEPVHK